MKWTIANDELYHYGTPGMKWGVRNYINEDGTLTAAGRDRYRTSSGKYVQSSGLQKRKSTITQLQNTARALQGKENRAEKKQVTDQLKKLRASYSADSNAERAAYTANQKAEREELKQERENLKEVSRYSQFNKGMARSTERLNKFTELIGRYRGQSAAEIKARKDKLANQAQEFKNESERVRNQDIREATSQSNVDRFRSAMKNYKKRTGGGYSKRSSSSYKNSHIRKMIAK